MLMMKITFFNAGQNISPYMGYTPFTIDWQGINDEGGGDDGEDDDEDVDVDDDENSV